jgi:biopolymer transport protein ExbD/biopolymer transport protein TolR
VSRRRRREGLPLNSEINVVSLIDVMLLLLVIFMITAPMMQGGVDVALPKADAKPLEPKSGLVVSVDRSGAVYVDETKMSLPEFRASFAALASKRAKDGVYLRGDASVPYGVVTQVLAIMRGAGVGDVGLVTDPESGR